MSSGPSIVFSAFQSASDPRLQGWATLRENVRAGTRMLEPSRQIPGLRTRAVGATPPDSAHSGIWRLLASNSRELGRSSSVYGSFVGAREHVLKLQNLVDDMVITTVTGPTSGTHGWIVTIGEAVVMTTGRWYGAASASREAAAGTIQAFRLAIVTADPRHSQPSGQRGTRVLTDAEKALSW